MRLSEGVKVYGAMDGKEGGYSDIAHHLSEACPEVRLQFYENAPSREA